MRTEKQILARREFLWFLAFSPLFWELTHLNAEEANLQSPADLTNVFQFEEITRKTLSKGAFDFVHDGADDGKTIEANRKAFDEFQIRVRRLIDVSKVDTSIELFGEKWGSPIVLCPVGFQGIVNAEGELATARAAGAKKHLQIVSTVSTYPIDEVAKANPQKVWFQLYPTRDRGVTKELLNRANAAGCPVTVLTVDTPVLGNRESQIEFFKRVLNTEQGAMGNFRDLKMAGLDDPTLTWDFLDWIRANTKGRIVVKGIVTHEDARLCIDRGADAIMISNHGGRQEESNRGTMECLSEIMDVVGDKTPVLIDGGFRRGTDIFKALAFGARAVGIGRPYIWGLGAFGQAGVERVLELLQAELIRIMQLAGTTSINKITPAFVVRK